MPPEAFFMAVPIEMLAKMLPQLVGCQCFEALRFDTLGFLWASPMASIPEGWGSGSGQGHPSAPPTHISRSGALQWTQWAETRIPGGQMTR